MVDKIAAFVMEHGIVAVIAVVLLYYILRVQTVRIREGFQNIRFEMAMQTAASLAVTSTLSAQQQLLTLHHATVLGVNESIGKDADERAAIAASHFSEIKNILERQREDVSQSTELVRRYIEKLSMAEEGKDDASSILKSLLSKKS